jgi:hypothetical protein
VSNEERDDATSEPDRRPNSRDDDLWTHTRSRPRPRRDQVGGAALEDDPPAVVAGAGAEGDDPVSMRQDRLVMRDNDDRCGTQALARELSLLLATHRDSL